MRHAFLAASVAAAIMCLCSTPSLGATTYQYDALGRVTTVTYDDGSQMIYSYDAAGNRTQVVSSANIAPITIQAIIVPLNGLTLIPLP